MASFFSAFSKTASLEGGYVNNPLDPGGETYRGISRRHHGQWEGWPQVEVWLRAGKPKGGPLVETLDRLTREFYRQQYWAPLHGDRISSQGVAEELYDTAVNMGIDRAVRFLQVGINALNRGGRVCPDVTVDGQMGEKTLASLEMFLKKDDAALFLKTMNILQGNHYLSIIRNNPSQEAFARGWLKRVEFAKS